MRIVAIDPSSSKIGYALFANGKLTEHGVITPHRTRDEANDRIRHMAGEVLAVLDESLPLHVVIEDTSGKVGTFGRRRGMNGAGLAIHGKAVGYVVCLCEAWARRQIGAQVHCVKENEWTRGQRKGFRQQWVAAAHRGYDPAQDKGGDASDAIGLGEWWLATERAKAPSVA